MSKKRIIYLGSAVVVIVIVLLFITQGSGGNDHVTETYYNHTYGFSFAIPESMQEAGYQVFESDRGIVAFDHQDGTRLFEIHMYTAEEWEEAQAVNETVIGESQSHVFTYFASEGALSEADVDRIQESFLWN